jgi:hypothetical protein
MSAVTGSQLAHDKVDRYRSLGAFGKPVYQGHVQLRAMLKGKLGERAANYFAKPTFDPDMGELRWTAEVPGAVRGWRELRGDEQAERALDLEVLRSQLMGYAADLRSQSAGQPGGAASFASLLEQAMRVPAQGDFLYFVGDQPVIAFWGFEDRDGASADPSAVAPRLVPAPGLAAAAAPVIPAVLAPEPAPPAPRRRAWWWWLLWALLALALLALLFFLLRGCTPQLTGLPSADPAASAPLARPAESPASVPSAMVPGPDTPASAPGLALPQGEGTGPSMAPALPGSAPGDASTRAPPSDTASVPGTPLQPEPGASSALPGVEPPPGRDPALARPPAEPAVPPPPLPPVEDRGLALPERAATPEAMNFLKGDWRAGEGLVDAATKQPLDLSLRFGPRGEGEIRLRRPDGSTCSGPVQGRMNGARLSIQGEQAVPCSNGGQYSAPRIECARERGGKTQCYGINGDGSRYAMGMEKSK